MKKQHALRLGLAIVAIYSVPAWAGEKAITADQLPEAVLEAAKKACPEGLIKKVSKETEDGAATYELKILEGDKKTPCKLEITEEGTLIELKRGKQKPDEDEDNDADENSEEDDD